MDGSAPNSLKIDFPYIDDHPARVPFLLDVVPFNSGHWTVDYVDDGSITLSCSDVTRFARVDSIKLVEGATGNEQFAVLEQGDPFPPSKDWSMTVEGPGDFSYAGGCVLAVEFTSDLVSVDEAAAELALVRTAAREMTAANVCKSYPAWPNTRLHQTADQEPRCASSAAVTLAERRGVLLSTLRARALGKLGCAQARVAVLENTARRGLQRGRNEAAAIDGRVRVASGRQQRRFG